MRNKNKANLSSRYHRRFIVCLFFISLVFHFYLIGSQHIQQLIDTIPECEKQKLTELFNSLFNYNNFSYTLFGDKPMSLAVYPTSLFDNDGIPSDTKLDIWSKWAVWKKYEKMFPMKHYLLIERLGDRKSKYIYFINKKYLIEKVNEDLSLFQKAFGKRITGDHLLKKIEENPKLISLLEKNSMLLGILFGYGKHNAQLFNNRAKLSPFVYKKEFPEIPIKIPAPSKGFSSLKEEFNSYFSVLTLFGDPHYSPLIVDSVHFVADHTHPETIALQQKYRKMRGEISAIYAKGSFLEITLSKLTED